MGGGVWRGADCADQADSTCRAGMESNATRDRQFGSFRFESLKEWLEASQAILKAGSRARWRRPRVIEAVPDRAIGQP